MGYRYRTGDRIFGGSMEPRFNPAFGGDKLNVKLGPNLPSPLVRSTNQECVRVPDDGRKARIGLPERFRKY